MSIAHLLEDFSGFAPGAPARSMSEDMLEEYRLDAFENGYKSGWDDATHAHAGSQTSISAELAQNLLALSFTYHDARDHFLSSLAPLFRGIVETMVPALAEHSLASHVAQQLEELAGTHVDQPVEISVAPGNCDKLRAILDPELPMDVSVRGEPTLGEGQARIGFGNEEREIDIADIVDTIEAALASPSEPSPKEEQTHD
jgi:flagellar assembly protein FliH